MGYKDRRDREDRPSRDFGGFRSNFGREFSSAPREMHKVTCSECGAEAEVPFKPSGDRPVYCKTCYQKHRKPRRY